MSQTRAILIALAGMAIAFSASGCGGATPVPTKGVVLLDGKPLAQANVLFIAQEPGGKHATGYTDASGAFDLTTDRLKDGALPGTYKVTVHYAEAVERPKNLRSPAAMQQATIEANEQRGPTLVPEIYTRSDLTVLTHRVPEDGDARFELRREP